MEKYKSRFFMGASWCFFVDGCFLCVGSTLLRALAFRRLPRARFFLALGSAAAKASNTCGCSSSLASYVDDERSFDMLDLNLMSRKKEKS
jgi:hypothetical protein